MKDFMDGMGLGMLVEQVSFSIVCTFWWPVVAKMCFKWS